MTMTVHPGWPLRPDICRFDLDLVEYLEGWPGHEYGRMFHLGPGLHHTVGRWAAGTTLATLWAITNSVEEMQTYMTMAIENEAVRRHYQCIFGDIYAAQAFAPEQLVLASLPHLGEAVPRNHARDLLTALHYLHRLRRGGRMVFYHDGAAWDRQEEVIRVLTDRPAAGQTWSMTWTEQRSLVVLRKGWADDWRAG